MKKKLLSLTLAFFLITTSVAALAYVQITNWGNYILKIEYRDRLYNEQETSLHTNSYTFIRTLPYSNIHLKAVAGKSTDLISIDGKEILCEGTTIIGFSCKYTS